MFAPVGFVPFSHIFSEIPESAYKTATELCDKVIKDVEEFSYPTPKKVFSTISPADYVEARLFEHFDQKTWICSPSGQMMHLDLRSISSQSKFSGLQLSGLMRTLEPTQIPKTFVSKYRLLDWPTDEFWSEFENEKANPNFLQPWKFAETLGMAHRYHEMPLFYERQGYTICFESYDFVMSYDYVDIEDLNGIVEVLRPFEGWSLCVKAGDAEDQFLAIWRDFAIDDKFATTGGRPANKRLATIEAYRLLYPDGHGSDPWLVVLRQVNKSTGLSVSVDTLRRAVTEIQRGQS
ncbi:hypothetical protein [uncultured Shimia sp.]|uniref:hypothetical protein n=1 Tax=uncultured Shimia sp. TaxID=573152 RepID=UPI00260505BA|nr:hypothetical protein [uncultured Shimia sp.]